MKTVTREGLVFEYDQSVTIFTVTSGGPFVYGVLWTF